MTGGAPEAAGLLDDAAFLPARPGFDAVVTTDAVVEGVHFLPGTAPDLVARKLLRVNLSDLAAKAAEPFGYWLTVAWPPGWGEGERTAFAAGLAADGAEFGIRLLGGDTVSTPGPMTASVTALGYAPEGRAVRRSGARPGDLLFLSGPIGDGWLGLAAARGGLADLGARTGQLERRYLMPEPRLGLRPLLQRFATAGLDISDGLAADLGHLAKASGVGIELDLERLRCSPGASAWLRLQAHEGEARAALATGGDDYELAFTVGPGEGEGLRMEAAGLGLLDPYPAGRVTEGEGVTLRFGGDVVHWERLGWRHG